MEFISTPLEFADSLTKPVQFSYPRSRFAYTALEPLRVPFEAACLYATSRYIKNLPQGDGHPVMVLPPYMASDTITTQLRRAIERWGYDSFGWALGANLAHSELNTMEGAVRERHKALLQVEDRLDKIYQSTQRKVSLVGWSLGGLHAHDLALRNPEKVRQVITLGSPLGDPRGTAIFAIVARITGNVPAEQEIREWIGDIGKPLQNVPCTSIYSNSDGVVTPDIAKVNGPLSQNICVQSSHVGMAFNRRVYYVVADRLTVPEEQWTPFETTRLKKCLVA